MRHKVEPKKQKKQITKKLQLESKSTEKEKHYMKQSSKTSH